MYLNLTGALTTQFIEHLKAYWRTHPLYKGMIDNIQGKYSFKTRPQQGIIVKPSGSTHKRLSADNFMGTVRSHLIHYKIRGYPGNSIEWLIENQLMIKRNGGAFPSPPGVYYVDVLSAPTQETSGILTQGTFEVTPLLDVRDELVMMTSDTEGQLLNTPISPGSERLYQMPFGAMLYEGRDYTINYESGDVTFAFPIQNNTWISADYRYIAEKTGPHYFGVNTAQYSAIPGAVLAFGRRAFAGDRFAVIVQERRSSSALEFGGRWTTSFNIDIMARDVHAQREIQDMTAFFLEGPLRSKLASQGIIINEVGIGGDSEEIYDETGQDYFYNGNITMSVESEWFVWVPLAAVIRQAAPFTVEETMAMTQMSNEEIAMVESNIKAVEKVGFQVYEDPFISSGTGGFSTIG
jgi:hypothetical protein